MQANNFNTNCIQCPRLATFLQDVRKKYPDYYGKPVPAFGDPSARLCIVGLAPGMHGANATGRPFTGDYAGILLYETLHKYGFASKAESVSANDDLKLNNCRITNAVKCLPPQNKPVGSEINTCNTWLAQELQALPDDNVIIAIGGLAHKSIIKALGLRQADYIFGHDQVHKLDRGILIDSYHCSRYNTQTRRLTTPMFEAVFKRAKKLLE